MRLFSRTIFIVLISLCGCKNNEAKNSRVSTEASINDRNDTQASPVLDTDITPISPSRELPPPVLPPSYSPYGIGFGGGSHSRKGKNHGHGREFVHFVPNSYRFWTNPLFATTHLTEGCTGSDCECTPGDANCEAIPAFANVLLDPTNFVWCQGGPYALCYYSGPNNGSIDLSCKLSDDGRFANCKCFEIPWGVYFVDINAILNYPIYQETIDVCGADGSGCSGSANINKAPVCEAINKNRLIPGADLVSAFSLDCVPTNGLGQTDCSTPSLYAGCMTAPCKSTSTKGIVECSCPTFDGPYQVGTALDNPAEECTLGDNLVWSAAFSPSGVTIPPLSTCIPDAPGANGCPLFNNTMSAPMGTDCEAICDAYACKNAAGIEPAYTCDATLCTSECNERFLLEGACGGLADCPAPGLAAIAKLESDVQCSCCASQLCGCEPNAKTNNAIFDLNQRQRDLSIVPQCDVNGTLCGIDAKNHLKN